MAVENVATLRVRRSWNVRQSGVGVPRSQGSGARRSSAPGFEGAGEVGGGFVAEFGGDAFDEGVGVTELDGGLRELEAGEAGERGFGIVTLEEAGEVGGGDVAGFGGLLDAVEHGIIAEQMTAAAQVGGVGGVHLGGGGLAGVGAEDEGVVECGTGSAQAKAAAAQGVIDDFFEE